MYSSRSLAGLAVMASLAPSIIADCQSFGVDFQDGGSYFQNSLSKDNFTFVSQFEGCQNDQTLNLLVNPNGTQVQCSNTDLQPDDTNELSTCPLEKDQLASGEWSVLIISNNAQADPFAYQRDFYLSVGPQKTTTYTPTVTLSYTSTPVFIVTSTTTDTSLVTLAPSTVTKPSTVLENTRTITPAAVTTITIVPFTRTYTSYSMIAVNATRTVTPGCKLPTKPPQADRICTVRPTINGITAAAMATASAKNKFRRVRDNRVVFVDKISFLEERRARLADRAPDAPTLTVMATDTCEFITSSTAISTAATCTLTVYNSVTVGATVTPNPIIVVSGVSTAPVVTDTAPTPTITKTHYNVATTWIVKSISYTVTINSNTTSSAAVGACKREGGTME